MIYVPDELTGAFHRNAATVTVTTGDGDEFQARRCSLISSDETDARITRIRNKGGYSYQNQSAENQITARDNAPSAQWVVQGQASTGGWGEARRVQLAHPSGIICTVEAADLVDILKESSISGGVVEAPLAFVQEEENLRLVRVGSAKWKDALKGSEGRNGKPFKKSELEIGYKYMSPTGQKEAIFLGKCHVLETTLACSQTGTVTTTTRRNVLLWLSAPGWTVENLGDLVTRLRTPGQTLLERHVKVTSSCSFTNRGPKMLEEDQAIILSMIKERLLQNIDSEKLKLVQAGRAKQDDFLKHPKDTYGSHYVHRVRNMIRRTATYLSACVATKDSSPAPHHILSTHSMLPTQKDDSNAEESEPQEGSTETFTF